MRILIRADGYNEIGLGHIFRSLILAEALAELGQDVLIATMEGTSGADKLRQSKAPHVLLSPTSGVEDVILSWRPDVIVTDVLDTDLPLMRRLRPLANRLVSLEDKGQGARLADAVVNAIYEKSDEAPCESDCYWGAEYICLRKEVTDTAPYSFRETPTSVLATFGGTDPLDMSSRIFGIFEDLTGDFPDVRFKIVLGPGYSGKLPMGAEVPASESSALDGAEPRIELLRSVSNLSDMMCASDLILCSQGTTPYEAACLNVPTVVIAQNERELSHTFACAGNGFVDLGLGSTLADSLIEQVLSRILSDADARRDMHEKMRGIELSGGTNRVCDIIMGV